MLSLLLLTLVSQAQATPAPGNEPFPPQVMAAVVKAAERVAAIGQTAVVCQAAFAADRTYIDGIRKEQLALVEKVAGVDRDITAARERQRIARTPSSPEYSAAARDIVHATTVRNASARRANELAAEERQLASKIRLSEACVSKARAELEALTR